MKHPRLLLAAAAALLCMQGAVQAQTYKMTIASGQPLVFPYIALLRDFFVPEIDKRLAATPYRIQWTQAYAGTVMKIGSEIESVQDGLVDVAFVLFTNNQSKLPLHTFTYFAPFSSIDPAKTVAAFNSTQTSVKAFGDTWTKVNQVYLASVAIESFNLYSKKPIRTVADLKGIKVGVIGPNANWLRNTGAVGVTFNLAQISNDLQNGVFEAALLADSVAAAIKLHEAGPYRTQFDVGSFVFAGLTINRDKWNSFPQPVRDVIRAVAQEYEARVATQLQQRAKEGVEGMVKAGLTNIEVPTAGRAEWANLMPNLAREWVQQTADKGPSKDILSTYLGSLRSGGVQPLRDWSAQ
jgi:TRAP-type C4-dicarboxylate transport system substrate-binding protein